MTYSTGNHTLKFGGDVNFVKDIINNLRFSVGEFNYTGGQNGIGFNGGLGDFVIDYTNFLAAFPVWSLRCYSSTRSPGRCYGGNFNQGFGVLGLTMKTRDINLFVQDDWRATQRLTLNLGLRYEIQQNPDPININPLLPQTGNKVSDNNNFGPRFGFAYDVQGDGKTSVRGGYGIYYGRVINSTVYNALVNTGVGITQGQRQVTVTATNAIAPSLSEPDCCGYFDNAERCSTLPQISNYHKFTSWTSLSSVRLRATQLFLPRTLEVFGNSLPNFVDTNLRAPTANSTF